MTLRFGHVLLAAAFHIALFAFMAIGVQCTEKPQPPVVIEAVMVTGKNVQAKAKQPEPSENLEAQEQIKAKQQAAEQAARQQAEADQKRQEEQRVEQERRNQETERKRQEAEEVVKKQQEAEQAEIARQKVEQERKQQEEQQRKQAEAEEQKKRQQEEQRKADEARKAEEERKRKEEAARKIADQKAQEAALRKALQAEEDQMAQAAAIAGVQNEWAAQIVAHVSDNWLQPPGLTGNPVCKVRVTLLSTGQLATVTIVQRSTSAVFDDSVEKAVWKSDPFPLPSDPKAFVRELTLTFDPQSLSR